MIKARSRVSLTPLDIDFILHVFSEGDRRVEAIKALLRDRDFLDHLLDRPELFDHVVRGKAFTWISPALYFYVLIRHGLRRSGIDNRDVSDYIASLLVEFAARERLHRISYAHDEIFHYIVDLVGYLDGANLRDRFLIRTHIGNYSLFLLGLFIDHVEAGQRHGRRITGVNYYEDMGSTSYRLAAGNRLAEQLNLVDVLTLLAENFHFIRTFLNRIAREYLYPSAESRVNGLFTSTPSGHTDARQSRSA